MLRRGGWIEGGTRGVLEQVVAVRDECSPNITACVSLVSNNNIVSHLYLAMGYVVAEVEILNRDTATIVSRLIAVDGAKGDASLSTPEYNAATIGRCCIVRDSAIDYCQHATKWLTINNARPSIVDAAT